MTKREVAELVVMLRAAYPAAKVTPATGRLYEAMLLDLDHEAAKRAIARLIATAKWIPTIAEIRAEAAVVSHGSRRLGGEAWGDVGRAVRKFGRYSEPEFEDPIVAECVRQMGWLSLCNSTNDVADRARFIELYDGMAVRDRRELVAGSSRALPVRQPLGSLGSGSVAGLLSNIGTGGKR